MTDSTPGPADLFSEAPRVENGDLRRSPGVFVGWVILLAFFGLLYAYDAWTAVQNVITVPSLITQNYDFYRQNGLDGLIKPVPWIQLIIAIVAPFAAFTGALLAGRGRSLWRRVLLLVAGFAAVSAIAFAVSAYVSSRFGL